MPRGDGTGPFGQGSMTGRGAGDCVEYLVPGCASSPALGRGPGGGRGAGSGRGHRNRFCATGVPFRACGPRPEQTLGPQEDVSLLKSEAERLRSMLETIERRLEQLPTT